MATSATSRSLNCPSWRTTIGKMPPCIAKFADVGTNGLGLQVQCLGNLPFRSAFPPHTNEHSIALGFGRRSIPRRIFGSRKRPDIPVRNP